MLGRTSTKLLGISHQERAAMAINEAMHQRAFDDYPSHPLTWRAYLAFHRYDGWLQLSVVGLLLLTVFETPLWCNSSDSNYWAWQSSMERCTAKAGMPASEVLMFGLPMLPTGVGTILEILLLITVLLRISLIAKIDGAFRECSGEYREQKTLAFDYLMIILGLCDAGVFVAYPSTTFRIAPYVRFGLAASLPWMRDILYSFWRVLVAISKVAAFLFGTVVIFAWITAMIFDDFDQLDPYGQPVNQGFESFGNALHTSFATMTTALLPDVLVPSYSYSRLYILLWLPFLALAVCIFTQVTLATVYGDYQEHMSELVKAGSMARMRGIDNAFELMKEELLPTELNCKKQNIVRFETFLEVAEVLRSFLRTSVDRHFLRLLFGALDENGDGFLTHGEFHEMCDVLQTTYTVTRRDSPLRERLGAPLRRLMDNGAEGPDFGYKDRFKGSLFDHFMNAMLAANVVWVVLESVVDLNDMPEPEYFWAFDLFFSLIYLLEVGLKLSYWSWGEYWSNWDNGFDFVTTMVLASSGFAFLFLKVGSHIMRWLNLLRLVRLLKALKNVPAYQEVWSVIERMVDTCSDVLAMNFLVIYLWSAAGVQMFGGELWEGNPRFKGQELAYFESHYQVYNFNDIPQGMVTLLFFTLGSWLDPIASACMALAEPYTFHWALTGAFLLTFYVASPLLAFNVFTAYSIEVFCKIQEMDESPPPKRVMHHLDWMRQQMAAAGLVLHIKESVELSRSKVYREMFLPNQTNEMDH